MTMAEWANDYAERQRSARRGGKRMRFRNVTADIQIAHPRGSVFVIGIYGLWVLWWAVRIWWAIHHMQTPVSDWNEINPGQRDRDD